MDISVGFGLHLGLNAHEALERARNAGWIVQRTALGVYQMEPSREWMPHQLGDQLDLCFREEKITGIRLKGFSIKIYTDGCATFGESALEELEKSLGSPTSIREDPENPGMRVAEFNGHAFVVRLTGPGYPWRADLGDLSELKALEAAERSSGSDIRDTTPTQEATAGRR